MQEEKQGIVKRFLRKESDKVFDYIRKIIDEKIFNIKRNIKSTQKEIAKQIFFSTIILTGIIIFLIGIGIFLDNYLMLPRGLGLTIWGLIIILVSIIFKFIK